MIKCYALLNVFERPLPRGCEPQLHLDGTGVNEKCVLHPDRCGHHVAVRKPRDIEIVDQVTSAVHIEEPRWKDMLIGDLRFHNATLIADNANLTGKNSQLTERLDAAIDALAARIRKDSRSLHHCPSPLGNPTREEAIAQRDAALEALLRVNDKYRRLIADHAACIRTRTSERSCTFCGSSLHRDDDCAKKREKQTGVLLVTVCDACGSGLCWQGEILCEWNHLAGTQDVLACQHRYNDGKPCARPEADHGPCWHQFVAPTPPKGDP